MAEATLVHGSPLMVDYTPSGADVTAGEVLLLGSNVIIAHKDITDGELGAMALGGGVYDIAKATGSGTDSTAGTLYYWDASANKATETAGSNKKIGISVLDAETTDTTVRILHIAQAV